MGYLIAMNTHSHITTSSFQKLGHDCQRKETSQHGHESVMNHSLLLCTNYRSGKLSKEILVMSEIFEGKLVKGKVR